MYKTVRTIEELGKKQFDNVFTKERIIEKTVSLFAPINANKLCLFSLIYRCQVNSDSSEQCANYIGLTEHSFKDRFYKHPNSFKYASKANTTELLKHVWDLKNSGTTDVSLNWSIVDRATPYKNGAKKINICFTEKFHVIFSPVHLINKRSELISKCRHENKFYLSNYKDVLPD